MDCKICGKGKVAYTGKGYWFKCGYCGIIEAYVDYYDLMVSEENKDTRLQ